MIKTYSVYALLEPEIRKSYIRYIGMTCQTVERRLQEHINKSKINDNYRCRWIRKLQQTNLKQQVICIHANLSKKEADQIEIVVMEYFTYLGAKLTNITNGGGGCLVYNLSEEPK